MARFEIFANPGGAGYLLDVQADLLRDLNTRVVVPLLPVDLAPRPAERLNPVFEVDGQPHVMATQFLSAIPASELGSAISSLADHHATIMNALDMLISGF